MKTRLVKSWFEVPTDFSGITEWPDGSIQWFLNGKRHRIDGPAVEHSDGEKAWYSNGEVHRIDGPAVERADGTKEYWIYDRYIEDETAFHLFINVLKLKGLAT